MDKSQKIKLETLLLDLEAIVGKGNVSISIFDRISYALDPMPYDLTPEEIPYAVVKPSSAEEVSEILKYANKHKIPVWVHGSGTALHGATRPKCRCIVLSTSRMKDVKIYEDHEYFECGPGVRVEELSDILEKRGYFLPLMPGSRPVATVGGGIAVNTSGHLVDSCIGKPSDYVLGLQVVLPTGEIIETGTKALRRPAGIDLTRIFVGSEGVLGVITKVRMRLIPKPNEEAQGVAFFKGCLPIARAVVRMYVERTPPPIFTEFMDEKCVEISFSSQGLQYPEESAVVMVRTMGYMPGEAKWKLKCIFNAFKKENPIEIRVVEDEHEWKQIWACREVVGSLITQKRGPAITGEIVPALPKLPDAMRDVMELPKKMKTVKNPEMYLYGHIGAPTIHLQLIVPMELSNDERRKFVKEVWEKTEALNIKYGGVGGEWGVTRYRIKFLKEKYGETYYNILLGLKKLLDPNNILNPGNLEGW